MVPPSPLLGGLNLHLFTEIQGKCHKKHDVIVIMDRTRQLNKRKARRFVELLKDILHKFDIRDGADHFGLLLFSNKSEVGIGSHLILTQ